MNVVDKPQEGRPRRRSISTASGCAASSTSSPAPANSKPTPSRSISPTSPRSSKATRRRCCFAPPGRRSRNWSAASWAAARGSPAPSARRPDTLLAEIQRRLKTKPEIVEVSRARSAVPAGGADRRRRRSHQAAGASAARRRRRALYLVVDRLRDRSQDRLHQRRPAPHDAARPPGGRHRPGGAERSARDLRGDARRRASDCR